MYVEGLSPFRTVARRLSVNEGKSPSPATISRWVYFAGKEAKDTIDMAQEFSPRWFGVLSIDGKSIKVSGIKYILLLACDIKTQDIIHALLVSQESYSNMKWFVKDIKEKIGYPLKSCVIDLRPGLLRALREIYPDVPVQACVIHLKRQVDQRLPKLKKDTGGHTNQVLRTLITKLLFSGTLNEALIFYQEILKREGEFSGKRQKSVVRMIKRNLGLIIAHHSHPDLPRDNNITENIIKQLNKKLKLLDGYQFASTANANLRLLVNCYRFKRFTDSRDKSKNGKSPLELAGVDISNLDWLTWSLEKLATLN